MPHLSALKAFPLNSGKQTEFSVISQSRITTIVWLCRRVPRIPPGHGAQAPADCLHQTPDVGIRKSILVSLPYHLRYHHWNRQSHHFQPYHLWKLTSSWPHDRSDAGRHAPVVFGASWRFFQLILILNVRFFVAYLFGNLSFCWPKPVKALRLRKHWMRLLEVSEVPGKKNILSDYDCLITYVFWVLF